MNLTALLVHGGEAMLVQVSHHKGVVRVRDERGRSFTVPGNDLMFGAVSAADGRVCIRFRSRPDAELFVQDPEQAEVLRLLCIKRLDVHGKTGAAFAALALGVAVIFFMGLGYLVRNADFAARAAVSVIPKTWERPLADLALGRLQHHGVCADQAGLAALAKLAVPLIRAADIRGYPPVKVIPVPSKEATLDMPPALALPGAVVVISGAMVEASRTPSELAAQLARALTQVRSRWPLQNLLTRLGAAGLSMAMMPFLAATQPAILAAGKMISFGYAYQGKETVDREAAVLLRRAGVDTEGLAALILRDGAGPEGKSVPEAVRLARQVRAETGGPGAPAVRPMLSADDWRAVKGVCGLVRVPQQ